MSVTGTVRRALKRNEFGDALDDDGNVVPATSNGNVVGTITGLIFGGQTVESVNTRGHVISTEGLVGVPAASAVQLTHGDLLEVDGIQYQCEGPPLWYRPHSLTGSPRRYTWIRVRALIN
ncbi:hypothetical protein BH10ACT9_BH10ACT9_35550 [soil metagenome]